MYNMTTSLVEDRSPPGYATATRTEIGSRPSQQDRVLICGGDGELFAFLCDGMGGTAQGEMASQRTADILCKLFSDADTHEMALKQPTVFLKLALTKSDEAVHRDASLNRSGTTLTALLLIGRRLYWSSVGDSRLYIMRGDEIVQATRDHNYRLYLDELMRQKRISRKQYEAELHRGRALISFIGIGNLPVFDLTQTPFVIFPDDIFLLTSDGLTGLLSELEIQSVLRSGGTLEQRADRLMQKALTRGHGLPMDNTTFALIQIL